MLKKIPVSRLQVGMHLHELCGPWLAHPFWRKKFVVQDIEDLIKLRASTVTECWIDTSKGLDVDLAPHDSQPGPLAPTPLTRLQAKPPPPPPPPARVRLEDEARRAAVLCGQAKRTVEGLFDEARMGRSLDVAGCMPLVEKICASVQRNASAMLGLVRLKTHDDYTYMHSVAVSTLMIAVAQRLGLDEAEVRDAGVAGMLHDVGKARIPLEVLNKPSKLTPAEFDLMRNHPRQGHALLLASGVDNAAALDVALHHHERPDGKGYPESISGERLSIQARMSAVCDVYDAITSQRAYKPAWSPADSIVKMAEWTKLGHFDPTVFRAFVDCVGIYPIGSLVRLRSERLATVVELNEQAPVSPRVKVFFSIRAGMPVPSETLDLSEKGCSDRIIARESNSTWNFPFLDDLTLAATAT